MVDDLQARVTAFKDEVRNGADPQMFPKEIAPQITEDVEQLLHIYSEAATAYCQDNQFIA
jgi:hypothetical protein